MNDIKGSFEKIDLSKLSIRQLRDVWNSIYGWQPEVTCKRPFLLGNLQYEQQSRKFGGLAQQIRKRIEHLNERFAINPHYRPQNFRAEYTPGTKLLREYRGSTYEVIIEAGGFRFKGNTYPSLTNIAREITGVSWNGRKFFGLSHGKSRQK